MSDGFIGRWSKRKLDAKEGRPVEAEPIALAAAVPPPQPSPGGGGSEGAVSPPQPYPGGGGSEESTLPPPLGEGRGGGSPAQPPAPGTLSNGGVAGQPPPLTLEDVRALTRDSDFSRFAAPGVAPEVKNAALKKLFSDPRYNVMDGLDVYIDDYSKPDPIPTAMLRQLVSGKFLKLFDQEEQKEEAQAPSRARDVADNPTTQSVAQSEPIPPAVPEVPDDADPDLRLQQDHAAPGEDPGDGAR